MSSNICGPGWFCDSNGRVMPVLQLIYLQQMAALLVRMKRTELRVKAKRQAAGAAADARLAVGNRSSSDTGNGVGLGAAGPKLD